MKSTRIVSAGIAVLFLAISSFAGDLDNKKTESDLNNIENNDIYDDITSFNKSTTNLIKYEKEDLGKSEIIIDMGVLKALDIVKLIELTAEKDKDKRFELIKSFLEGCPKAAKIDMKDLTFIENAKQCLRDDILEKQCELNDLNCSDLKNSPAVFVGGFGLFWGGLLGALATPAITMIPSIAGGLGTALGVCKGDAGCVILVELASMGIPLVLGTCSGFVCGAFMGSFIGASSGCICDCVTKKYTEKKVNSEKVCLENLLDYLERLYKEKSSEE